MKNFNILCIAAASVLSLACSSSVSVNGVIEGASGAEIIAKRLDINTFSVLDTVRTGKNGSFKLDVPVAEGNPEFVYLFYKDNKIASLLLEAGEEVSVDADTLGHYSVRGSEGSVKLQEVESRYASFVNDIKGIEEPSVFVRKYIEYYRESVKYVLRNPYSLTVVPVLFQNLGADAPVFAQSTDAIHFRNACDSLKTVYPDSRYVRALEKEAERREAQFKLENEIRHASTVGFPNLDMPGIDGSKKSLNSLNSKVILLNFWNSGDARQNNFLQEVLRPIYEDYHQKGLEIYSVCLDTDKVRWASVVNGQKLPWINVNDGLGAASPAVRLYNISSVPSTVIIADGSVSLTEISTVSGLRRELSRLLK